MSLAMLMEFAEVRKKASRSSASRKAAFTSRWQSSNVPLISKAVIFFPSVVNCFSWMSLTFPEGYKTITRIPGTSKKPLATALPVSPEVATRITISRSTWPEK